MPHEKPTGFLTTLRGRLVLLVCLATLPTILFAVYAAYSERGAVFKRAEEDALHLTRLASREHVHQIEGARSLLRWLGEVLGGDGEHASVKIGPAFLRALLVGHPQLANIGILSPKGQVLESAFQPIHFSNMQDNPAFVRALQSHDVETGGYVIGPIVRRPVLNLAYAVRNRDDQILKVAFVAVDLGWLGKLATQVNLPSDSTLVILDREGHILAQSGKEFTGLTSIPGLTAPEELSKARLLKVGTDPRPYFFVAAPMEEIPGVAVAFGLPREGLYNEGNRVFLRTLVVLVLVTLFTVGTALLVAEVSILRSLRSLSVTAKRFGAGDLSARVTEDIGHGELRELAVEFNSMAVALASRHRELLDAHAKLKALSRHLHVAREAEAAHIARELHDEIGQVLTVLKIALTSLPHHFLRDGKPTESSRALETEIEQMRKQIDAAVDFVRRICSQLRPTVLDRLGLAAAIEWQAREIEQHSDITVDVEIQGVDELRDPLLSITLFRIAQEALTNVVRHAQATLVNLSLIGTTNEIRLVVQDNGRGIDSSASDRVQSLGIIGMRERASLVGGSFRIAGSSGTGTEVTVVIPKTQDQSNHAHSDR